MLAKLKDAAVSKAKDGRDRMLSKGSSRGGSRSRSFSGDGSDDDGSASGTGPVKPASVYSDTSSDESRASYGAKKSGGACAIERKNWSLDHGVGSGLCLWWVGQVEEAHWVECVEVSTAPHALPRRFVGASSRPTLAHQPVMQQHESVCMH
jgi:hypothetical protein